MGLAPLLTDTYPRYKKGTGTFVQWLASATRATGTVGDVFETDLAPLSPKHRLKGKRRPQAKSQARTHKLQVKTFTRLARVIAGTAEAKVPGYILSILNDVIRARKSCAAWYQAHQTEVSDSTKMHNKGYRYFISVLVGVYDILSSLKEIVVEKDKQEGQHGRKDPSTNHSEALEVEKCPDWEGMADEMAATLPKQKDTVDKYEVEASDEDISVALYYFMKDLTDIRIFIRKTWREYKHSQITLNTASITMNTALYMIRRLSEAFVEHSPQFQKHQDIIDYLYDGYVDPTSKGDNVASKKAFVRYEADSFSFSPEIVFCHHITMILNDWFQKADLPMYQKDILHGKISANDETLLKCLSHLALIDFITHDNADKAKIIMLEDLVLRAVAAMRKEKRVYTWIVFAIQVFVDTHRELSDG